MGRRTFETIGKPLKGRRLIVLSESLGTVEGVEYVSQSPQDLIVRLSEEGVTGVVIAVALLWGKDL